VGGVSDDPTSGSLFLSCTNPMHTKNHQAYQDMFVVNNLSMLD